MGHARRGEAVDLARVTKERQRRQQRSVPRLRGDTGWWEASSAWNARIVAIGSGLGGSGAGARTNVWAGLN